MGGGSGSDETRPGAADSGARRPAREGAGESAAERTGAGDRSAAPKRPVPGARASAEGSEGAKSAAKKSGEKTAADRKPPRSAARKSGSGSGPGSVRRIGSRRPVSGRRFDVLRRRPRFRLTRRAGILALALCTVMVTVAYPLQEYLAQRSQIAAQNARNARTAQQIAQLKKQLAQWSDPNYVEIQARQRLHYVMPGEIGFIVPSSSGGSEPLGMPSPSALPWYDNLWSTLKSPSPSASPSPAP